MTSAGDRRYDVLINGRKSFVIRTAQGINARLSGHGHPDFGHQHSLQIKRDDGLLHMSSVSRNWHAVQSEPV
jgi:hypothetical protein